MPSRWQHTTLGDVCTFAGGTTFPKWAQGDSSGIYPFIKVSDMNLPGNERYIVTANNWVDEDTQVRLRGRLHPPGCTIFAKIGVALTYNRRRLLSQPTLVDNNMMSAAAIDGVVAPLFLYYLLCATDFNEVAVGTALPYLNSSDLRAISVSLPPLNEQNAISCILGALDDKIELNRRMSRTLEETARAIFKSWFVDFDPVRAKAGGQHPPGMKPEIAALFPDAFVDSELGQIPEAWEVRLIGDMVDVMGGTTPSTKEPAYWDGGTHPFCTPKDMSALRAPVLLDTERCITDEGLARISSGQLPRGTVLLSSRAPIGYVAITDIPVSVNQGIIAMVCDEQLPNAYVLHWTEENIDRVIANANGSTFLEISKRSFRPIPVLVPDRLTMASFVRIAQPLHRRIVSALRESQRLAEIRDALLPRLLSGELLIPHADAIVERSL